MPRRSAFGYAPPEVLTGFDLCRAALAVIDITAPEQSVLTVLAIMANDDAQCWPPINGASGLTGKTKLSERAVQNATKALEAAGHIDRVERRGRGMVYTVHPRTTCTPADNTPPQEVRPAGGAPTPASPAPKQPLSTNPSKATPSSGKRERPKQTRVPSDFQPAPAKGSITAKVMDAWPPGEVEVQVEHFIDHHSLNNTLFSDWQAAWRNWVKIGKRINGKRSYHSGGQSNQHPGGRTCAAADFVFGGDGVH